MRLFVPILLAAALLPAQTAPCPKDVFLDVSKFPGAGAAYPKPRLEVSCEGAEMVVRGNGIPHYEFVQVTPNPLRAQNYEFRVPLEPKRAAAPTAIPLLGSAGFAVNGLVFFGPNEGPVPAEEGFGDPIYNSIMDTCMGHTAQEYHYHAMVERCLVENARDGERSKVVGFAFDGFPIRGPWGCLDQDCRKIVKFKSSWEKTGNPEVFSWDAYDYVRKDSPEYLDQCNGHAGPDGDYHYHITESWPYIIGCYAGEPVGLPRGGGRGPGVTQRGPRPGPGGPRPTAEQVTAAAGALGIDKDRLARALRVNPGSVKPVNLAASAAALKMDERKLREALQSTAPAGPPRPSQAAGEPCTFRCGQSDADAVGCTLTPDHKVLCIRPCDNNKCG